MEFAPDISRRARGLRWIAWISLAIVVAVSLVAFHGAWMGQPTEAAIRLSIDSAPPERNDLIGAAASGLLFTVALWRLIRMLRRIEDGEIFTSGTIAELRGFTLFLLLSALTSILLPILLSFLDALSAPAGERRLVLDFSGDDFFSLLVAGLLFFLARLLGEAQLIAEDSRQIV